MEFVGFVVLMVLLAIVGGYIITSLLLFRFPTLIHKKKKLKFRCRHISHRGGESQRYLLSLLTLTVTSRQLEKMSTHVMITDH